MNPRVKNERVMAILYDKGLTVKELAALCGWDYQNLRNYLSFRTSSPKKDSIASLLTSLKTLDPTLTEEDCFPPNYGEIAKTLWVPLPSQKTKRSEIPDEALVPIDETMPIESHEKEVLSKLDYRKLFRHIRNVLEDQEYFILTSYYGIGTDRLTLEGIGEKLNLTRERVRVKLGNTLRKLESNKRIRPYDPYPLEYWERTREELKGQDEGRTWDKYRYKPPVPPIPEPVALPEPKTVATAPASNVKRWNKNIPWKQWCHRKNRNDPYAVPIPPEGQWSYMRRGLSAEEKGILMEYFEELDRNQDIKDVFHSNPIEYIGTLREMPEDEGDPIPKETEKDKIIREILEGYRKRKINQS